jgi:hypothetical protein
MIDQSREKHGWGASDYAEALEEELVRRSGRVPGTGKHICQKFALGAANSTPTKVLPSRALRIVVTLDSIDFPLFSLAICSVWPTTTGSSMGKSPPSRLTECEKVLTENFSPASVCQRTVNPTVSVTRTVRRRSLNRKCSSDIDFAFIPGVAVHQTAPAAQQRLVKLLLCPPSLAETIGKRYHKNGAFAVPMYGTFFELRGSNSKPSRQSIWPAKNAANNLSRRSSNPSPTC